MVLTSVRFTVGNTYQYVEPCNASLDRFGRYRKVHDWVCYVDFHASADVVASVSFGRPSFLPQQFCHYSPIRLRQSDGTSTNRWLFYTRQQTYAPIRCEITICGNGGSILNSNYQIRLYDFEEPKSRYFDESNPPKELGPVPLPERNFGVKFELLIGKSENPDVLVHSVMKGTRDKVYIRNMVEEHFAANRMHAEWKLSSPSNDAFCSNHSDFDPFELESPILWGEDGIEELQAVLQALQKVPIKMNKITGFCVSVEVEYVSIQELCSICQNFIKYEAVFDSILSRSRSGGNNCKSNKLAVPGGTNKGRHFNLASCRSIFDLCDTMNPSQDRYYKLNLQKIRPDLKSIVEFRQHSENTSIEVVLNWTRLCVWLVYNSIRLLPPRCLKESRTAQGESFEILFEYLIKDCFLRSFFNEGRQTSRSGTDDEYKQSKNNSNESRCGDKIQRLSSN